MDINALKKVGVIGGGLMGRQIALNAALHGYDTYIFDSADGILDNVRQWADQYLADRIKKERLTALQVEAAKKKFHIASSLEEMATDAELVIEAIIEDKKIKQELFGKLNKLVRKDAVISTNSSYMVSSLFADCVDDPSRLANLHFFNPALVMELTEVVKGAHTSQETADFLMEFSRRVGKTPVLVRKEIDGFIVNRFVVKIAEEAYYLMENGVATPHEIDAALEKGLNHPMGPFRLEDLTGVDLKYHILKRQYDDTGVKPLGYDIAKEKYDAGEWGRKSGKGWYTYE